MKHLLLLSSFICLFMPGCLLLSLQPYYEDKDVVEHHAFVGKWGSNNGKTIWEFIQKGSGYRVTINESGKRGEFKVTPFKTGEELFLNFYPDMTVTDETISPFYMIHRIPTHSLMHVETDGDAPVFRIPDFEWFTDYLKAHPDAIRHEWLDNGEFPVLRAPPAELQAFILKHLKTEGAFENLDLRRVTPAE